MKTYNLSFEEVTKKITYPNLILLSAVIPDYESETKDPDRANTLDAEDPTNREAIKALLQL